MPRSPQKVLADLERDLGGGAAGPEGLELWKCHSRRPCHAGPGGFAENDIDAVRKEILEAGKTPGLPQLDSLGPDMTLASEMLKKVIEYFGLCRDFWKLGAAQPDAWTETVQTSSAGRQASAG